MFFIDFFFRVGGELSFENPVDFSSFMPSNLITTMIYALGILSLVNLILGLIPDETVRAAAEERAEAVDTPADTAEGRQLTEPLAKTVFAAISKLAGYYD